VGFAIAGGLVNRAVTSGLTMTDDGGQMLLTGALSFNLRRSGRLMPYVVGGGGLWFSTGDGPELTLSGDYQFTSLSGNVYHQTDTVRARFKSGTSGVVLGGIGVKYELNSKSGVRVDYRFHAGVRSLYRRAELGSAHDRERRCGVCFCRHSCSSGDQFIDRRQVAQPDADDSRCAGGRRATACGGCRS
jgi:hypothetical protein